MSHARIVSLVATLLLAAALPAAAPAAPFLDAALTCGRAGVGGVARGRDLYKIPVDQTLFPDAHCNDGTGAVFYVRRQCPTTADTVANWHIHLDGGGACTTAQECANRWCRWDTNFGANKMSSRGTPDRIRARGIFDRSKRNAFRCWNHVFVYYCSSDIWRGESTDIVVNAENPADLAAGVVPPGAVQYRIDFRGASIVDAVVAQLRRDCNGAACPVSAYSFGPDENGDGIPDEEMPDLDDATTVVLSGSSAGSGGARIHADALGTRLRQHNTHCLAGGVCPLDYRLVIDAGIAPDTEGEDFTPSCLVSGWCGACAATNTCTYADYMMGNQTGSIQSLGPTRAEDSCTTFHAAGDGETWRCNDGTHLALHHIGTPYFVRSDEQDELVMKNQKTAGFTTCPDYGAASEALHRALFGAPGPLDQTAEEGSVLSPGNPPLAVPGVFAPQHNDHVGLAERTPFFRVRMEDPPGSGILHSFHDVLRNWMTGGVPQQLVNPFGGGFPPPPPALPWCP